MGRKKITILIENEINNHQIYVTVFYLIEINILIAYWGQKWWNFMIVPLLLPLHACKCTVWIKEKKIKFSQILEIDIFKFIFGIRFNSNSSPNTTILFGYRFRSSTNLFNLNFSFQTRVCQFAAHRLLCTEDSKKSPFRLLASTWVARKLRLW